MTAPDAPTCRHPGCGRRLYAMGFCLNHYRADLVKRRRSGEASRNWKRVTDTGAPRLCRIKDCGKPVFSRRMCLSHYQQDRDAIPELRRKRQAYQREYKTHQRRVAALLRAGLTAEAELLEFKPPPGYDIKPRPERRKNR